mgnify:CR=1 FL=1
MGEGCTAADQKEVLESGWDHPMPLGRNHNEGIGRIDFFCQSLQTAPLRRITANFLVPERQGIFSKVKNPAAMIISKAYELTRQETGHLSALRVLPVATNNDGNLHERFSRAVRVVDDTDATSA